MVANSSVDQPSTWRRYSYQLLNNTNSFTCSLPHPKFSLGVYFRRRTKFRSSGGGVSCHKNIVLGRRFLNQAYTRILTMRITLNDMMSLA
jgi:hypothetical protein